MIYRKTLISAALVANAFATFASPANAGGCRAERVCDSYAAVSQCASWRNSNCREYMRTYRWHRNEIPDNNEDPWSVVPFNPDKFWEWLRRNSPG
jgi:hypothetical protein